MRQPSSILFAHFGLDWITGSERCLLDLVAHLDRARFRPVVVCNAPALADAAERLGATVHCSREFVAPDQLFPPTHLVAHGHRLVRDERIDLIHANDFQPVKWLLPAARRAHIPTLLHVHLPSSEEERCYAWVHQVACVVGVSQAAVAGFLDDGLRRDRVTVIYNGVDPERLCAGDATELRRTLGISGQATVLALVGSLIERKGIDVVLRAMSELQRQSRGDVHLVVLGDGPQESHLKQLSGELGLDRVVTFLGRRPDAGAVLRDVADIAVTAAWQEAFPLNVLEAGFFGLPVVASDIPPHREGVREGVTGLLVPAGDHMELARALGRVIDDVPLRERLGAAAHAQVHERFIIDDHVRRFCALYEHLMSQRAWRYGWIGGSTWPPAYTRWLRRIALAKMRRTVPATTA
jgi:glycosyltransferase involved in cell wall biosynthesis